MTARRGVCYVCRQAPAAGDNFMCRACGASLDRQGDKDSSISGVIIWAAERARRFEARRRSPPICTSRANNGMRCVRERGHDEYHRAPLVGCNGWYQWSPDAAPALGGKR